MVATSFEVIHDLAGLPNPTEVSPSHCLRMLSVGSLGRNRSISNTYTTAMTVQFMYITHIYTTSLCYVYCLVCQLSSNDMMKSLQEHMSKTGNDYLLIMIFFEGKARTLTHYTLYSKCRRSSIYQLGCLYILRQLSWQGSKSPTQHSKARSRHDINMKMKVAYLPCKVDLVMDSLSHDVIVIT